MFSSTMFCCPSTNIIPFSQYSRLVNLANNQPSVLNASTPNTFTTQTTSVDFNIQSRSFLNFVIRSHFDQCSLRHRNRATCIDLNAIASL
ncbi:Uncharacterized protein APZ42_017750 [Daphnia magna]|uniref:Uncharacterized protein n=1 Tax=Daphnia magna TaxID=35525 RepID=A0A0P5CC83_9CRUS|nr:Uncharacterized protein APZ42_017750 [Daphnia magna]